MKKLIKNLGKKIFFLTLMCSLSTVIYAQSFVWAVNQKGFNNIGAFETEIDTDGNAYVIGVFEGTADFDASPGIEEKTSMGDEDFFVLKLDPNGNFIWVKSFGGPLVDRAYSIELNANNDILIAGYFQDTVDFDPDAGETTIGAMGESDVFVLKLNNDGELIWVKTFGGNLGENCFKVQLDDDGNIYTTGAYHGTIDIDPGPDSTLLTAMYDHGLFIQKLDSDGNLIWGKAIDAGPGSISGRDLAINALGEIHLAVTFRGTIDADPGAGTAITNAVGDRDAIIIKLSPDGAYIWDRSFGTNLPDHINQLEVNNAGDVYVTGGFIGAINFGMIDGEPTLRTTTGGIDIYVLKVWANGDLAWVNTYGSNMNDEGWGLDLNSTGDVFVTGRYQGLVDFDEADTGFILESVGNYDVFFIKLNPNGELQLAMDFGGSEVDYSYGVTLYNDDQIYINGLYTGITDLNPHPSEAFILIGDLFPDGYVIKLMGVLSIAIEESELALDAYPNPAKDHLIIRSEMLTGETEVVIYNTEGKQVLKSLTRDQETIELNVKSLTTGMYFVHVINEASTARLSFVKL